MSVLAMRPIQELSQQLAAGTSNRDEVLDAFVRENRFPLVGDRTAVFFVRIPRAEQV